MRTLVVLALALTMGASVAAQDLGTQAPAKPPGPYPENVPACERQGGDTIASATVIPALPYNDSGTTAGYNDDYDAVCPYADSTAPDVVYRYEASSNIPFSIDMCGSMYDTKLYVYDEDLNLIACNDDFYFGPPCGDYVSRLDNIPVVAGTTYYFVVDGYGSAAGAYIIQIPCCGPCLIDCPTGGVPEGEPPLVDGYVDNWNGGCDTPGLPLQPLTGDQDGALTLCGVGGWYDLQGSSHRDTDWYVLSMGPGGHIDITADAEQSTYIFELGPQDCDAVGVVQQALVGPCDEGTMTIASHPPGASVWFWVGATTFTPPASGDDEYDYVVQFSGLEPMVATKAATWSAVKALYD